MILYHLMIIFILRSSYTVGQARPCDYLEIENGFIYKPYWYTEKYHRSLFPQPIGKIMYYHCNKNYAPAQGSHYWTTFSCTEEGWSPVPECLRVCYLHSVENGNFWPRKTSYMEGDEITIQCNHEYSLPNNQEKITCTKQGWSADTNCIKTKICDIPQFENARYKGNKAFLRPNETLEYECMDGYEITSGQTTGVKVCGVDEWPTILDCYEEAGKCGPPPSINNGDIISFPLSEYAPESRVEYRCQQFYVLRGSRFVTCRNRSWTNAPRCLEPCTVSKELMMKNNIEFKWIDSEKLYLRTGQDTEFSCIRGFHKAPSSPPFTARCIEGKINYPICM
ncbi:complement factor H-related protein 1-like isoform X1 [Trichosurus vulpecula]|uniref:complement factor H-related protein 1-like isoform X1 n=1 Tax=Trichosurus vulpecula TaxID=9337 RepID=UPI00186AECFF|nr:complement factor H-related protein 1-like isoform X1 [Trichosurus vulpecula]